MDLIVRWIAIAALAAYGLALLAILVVGIERRAGDGWRTHLASQVAAALLAGVMGEPNLPVAAPPPPSPSREAMVDPRLASLEAYLLANFALRPDGTAVVPMTKLAERWGEASGRTTREANLDLKELVRVGVVSEWRSGNVKAYRLARQYTKR